MDSEAFLQDLRDSSWRVRLVRKFHQRLMQGWIKALSQGSDLLDSKALEGLKKKAQRCRDAFYQRVTHLVLRPPFRVENALQIVENR